MSRDSLSKRSPRHAKWRADLFEIVNKKYDEGMTYIQIAEQMGLTVAQVKSKIRGRPRASV